MASCPVLELCFAVAVVIAVVGSAAQLMCKEPQTVR